MNGNSHLLDTVALVGLLNGDPVIQRRVQEFESTFAPSIALGELYFGAFKSEQVRANLNSIERLRSSVVELGCDGDTARVYGEIRDRLRRIGRPIPGNDVWIAAIAMQYDLTLLTRDAHFKQIDGLKVDNW